MKDKNRRVIIVQRKSTLRSGVVREKILIYDSDTLKKIETTEDNSDVRTLYRGAAFRLRTSHLPTYQVDSKSGKIVIPTDNVYLPSNHYTKKQYNEAMKFATQSIKLKNG